METIFLTSRDNVIEILAKAMDSKCRIVTEPKRLRLNFILDETCYSIRIESLRIQPYDFRKRINDLYGIKLVTLTEVNMNEKTENSENSEKVVEKEPSRNVKKIRSENGAYLTAYDLLKSLFFHMTNKNDCKGSKMESDSNKEEVGWKCSKCGDSWRISIRRLRNTIKDSRMKEFSRYSYMSTFDDLRKVLTKR